jgi:hypothetical protein
MTEAEWLTGDDPKAMLEYVRGKASDRKFWLFTAACVRDVAQFLPVDPHPPAQQLGLAEAYEGYADGQLTERDVQEVFRAGHLRYGIDLPLVPLSPPWRAARSGIFEIVFWREKRGATKCAYLGHLLRDVFGNPFRPTSPNSSWFICNDGAIRKTAQAIYDDHAFDRLPLLADALEDAGCTDVDILSHCRAPGEHVRGCWVVDLLLGKS